MNKKGFTLAELLVALGIVAVIAAAIIPSIHKIMPDKDKGAVLKVYKTLNEINADIFSDPTLYRFGDGSTNPDCSPPHILNCIQAPLDDSVTYTNANDKYPLILCSRLSLADSVTFSNGGGSFHTSDGITWTIAAGTGTNLTYTITIDVNNPSRGACTYSSSNCPNPGKFKFTVNSNGSVSPASDDYLTQAYLNNPNDMSNRTEDLRQAALLESEASPQQEE